MSRRLRTVLACALIVAASSVVDGQAPGDRVMLVVAAGRPLRVRLDQRITISHVGQIVTAVVVDPVYAYDRVVIPAGTTVTGHITTFETPSKWSRARLIFGGDFTPPRTPVVQFDRLALSNGTAKEIATTPASGRERVTMTTTTAAEKKKEGVVARGKEEAESRAKEAIESAKHHVHDAAVAVKAPDKMQRLRDAAVAQLPYHPQYLRAGTLYTAELLTPVSFGEVDASEPARAGDRPSPASVLTARLVTPLDSSKTPKGTPMQAVLTEPVFSADHRLLFAEGTTLDGEVTFAKHAASMHRNGQLRFLVERAQAPEHEQTALLASVYAVEASQDDRLVVDDEGGASATSSKTRFIAPALALMALHASAEEHHHRFDNDGDDGELMTTQGNFLGRGVAGWFGFSLTGTGLGLLSRPVAIGFGVYGAARSVYANVLARGRDVVFPANTEIQVQLSPAAERAPQ